MGIYCVQPSITASSLWDFAVALYAQPGVQSLCLMLQDCHAVNVNLTLYARWLEVRQIPLDLPAAHACIAGWDKTYVQALRQLRRQMKQEFAGAVEGVRHQIKRAELLAERQELVWLEQLAISWAQTDKLAAGENLQLYLRHLQVPEPVIIEAITRLTEWRPN
jgi:uncharacterized protein (TIGR02444 family)